jgi:hypothetical protein
VACGDATATIGRFQIGQIKQGNRMFVIRGGELRFLDRLVLLVDCYIPLSRYHLC